MDRNALGRSRRRDTELEPCPAHDAEVGRARVTEDDDPCGRERRAKLQRLGDGRDAERPHAGFESTVRAYLAEKLEADPEGAEVVALAETFLKNGGAA